MMHFSKCHPFTEYTIGSVDDDDDNNDDGEDDVIQLTAASSHFLPLPKGLVVSSPAVSSPPCRRLVRSVTMQVDKMQPRVMEPWL